MFESFRSLTHPDLGFLVCNPPLSAAEGFEVYRFQSPQGFGDVVRVLNVVAFFLPCGGVQDVSEVPACLVTSQQPCALFWKWFVDIHGLDGNSFRETVTVSSPTSSTVRRSSGGHLKSEAERSGTQERVIPSAELLTNAAVHFKCQKILEAPFAAVGGQLIRLASVCGFSSEMIQKFKWHINSIEIVRLTCSTCRRWKVLSAGRQDEGLTEN